MNKLSRNIFGMGVILVVLLTALMGIYAFGIHHFKSHFITGSKINGINIGEMTVDDAKYAIQTAIRGYTLTVEERGGKTETITGDQIYLQYVDNGTLDKLLKDQNPNLWLFYLGRGKNYEEPLGYTYDQTALETVMDGL
ncbi:MAG: hypothetical protein UHN88_07970, partial [Eubacterium sp.]|nr:hypothetical protein [Eubacterium sp.]